MRIGRLVLVAAVLLSGCDARPVVASIGGRDRPDDASYRVTGTITVGTGARGVAVDSSTHTVYVVNDAALSVIDAATHAVVAGIPVGHGAGSIAVDPGTHTVFVPNGNDGYVSVIDGATREVAAKVPVGKAPSGIAVDPTTHLVYVTNHGDETLSVIDGMTRAVIDTMQVVPVQAGVAMHHSGVAVDPETNLVYVSSKRWPEGELPYSSEHIVTVIDGSMRAVTATVIAGRGQSGLAVDSGAHIVYAANSWDKAVAAIDGLTNTVTAAVPVDGGLVPWGAIAVDPGTHMVFAIRYRANSIAVIDGQRRAVVANIATAEQLSGLAVDAVTHTVYATHYDGTVSIIENGP